MLNAILIKKQVLLYNNYEKLVYKKSCFPKVHFGIVLKLIAFIPSAAYSMSIIRYSHISLRHVSFEHPDKLLIICCVAGKHICGYVIPRFGG